MGGGGIIYKCGSEVTQFSATYIAKTIRMFSPIILVALDKCKNAFIIHNIINIFHLYTFCSS